MKLNPDKCHLVLNTKEQATLKIGNIHIKNALSEKLLGINFDYKLTFSMHIEDICQKSSRKINALADLHHIWWHQKSIFWMLFLNCNFISPLIWMCCNRALNHKINWLFQQCLHIQIMKKFLKEMVLSLFTIKISDF